MFKHDLNGSNVDLSSIPYAARTRQILGDFAPYFRSDIDLDRVAADWADEIGTMSERDARYTIARRLTAVTHFVSELCADGKPAQIDFQGRAVKGPPLTREMYDSLGGDSAYRF